MEKILKMGKLSASGSFQLFFGVATSTVIMAVGTIIIARILLPEEYGLYSIAVTPSLMIGLFRDWEMTSAMTRFTAKSRADNDHDQVHQIIRTGLIFEFSTGTVLTFFSLFLASFIASSIFHRPESTYLVSIASVTILSGALLAASEASFTGFDKMGLRSVTMILQAVAKVAISVPLVVLGYGALGATVGYSLAYLVTGIVAVVLLYLILLRKLPKSTASNSSISGRARARLVKRMLRYGVPLSIYSLLANFLAQFYSFMIASFCDNTSVGNYRAGSQFTVLLTFITIPITIVLFQAFAKVDPKREKELVRTVFMSSAKYTSMILVPATMAIIVLSQPMISTLFGDRWISAPFLLSLSVTANLLSLIGSLSMASMLAALGETRVLVRLGVLTLCIGIPLSFVAIPAFGIPGAIVGSLIAGLPSTCLGLYWILKHYEARVDIGSSVRIFFSSGVSAAVTYLSLAILNSASWLRLLTGGTIFLMTYVLTASFVRAMNRTDVSNLRMIFSGNDVGSRLINRVLNLLEKMIREDTSRGFQQ